MYLVVLPPPPGAFSTAARALRDGKHAVTFPTRADAVAAAPDGATVRGIARAAGGPATLVPGATVRVTAPASDLAGLDGRFVRTITTDDVDDGQAIALVAFTDGDPGTKIYAVDITALDDLVDP